MTQQRVWNALSRTYGLPQRDLSDLLRTAISLNERERAVLDARINVGQTLLEVSTALGISRERTRQIEQRAIKYLKKRARGTL